MNVSITWNSHDSTDILRIMVALRSKLVRMGYHATLRGETSTEWLSVDHPKSTGHGQCFVELEDIRFKDNGAIALLGRVRVSAIGEEHREALCEISTNGNYSVSLES